MKEEELKRMMFPVAVANSQLYDQILMNFGLLCSRCRNSGKYNKYSYYSKDKRRPAYCNCHYGQEVREADKLAGKELKDEEG